MDILTPLYIVTSSCAALAFVPQIIRLLHAPETRKSMALSSWCGFTLASLIALAYAALRAQDVPMMITAGCYLVGNLGVLLAALLPARYQLHWPQREPQLLRVRRSR